MVRPATPQTTQMEVSTSRADEYDVGSFNLLKLHQEIASIQYNDASSQEKSADFIRLVTRITNAVATAWYDFDLISSSADESEFSTQQLIFCVQRKHDSIEAHRGQMKLVAERAARLESLQIAQHEQDPTLSIIAAPCIPSKQNAYVLVQVLQLGDQPAETYALILQIVASFGAEYRALDDVEQPSSNRLLLGPARAEDLNDALQALCDACCEDKGQNAIAATKIKTGFNLRCSSREHALPQDANRVNDITRAMLEAAKYEQTLIIDERDANKSRAPLLYNALNGMQCAAVSFCPIKGANGELHSMILICGESKQELSGITQNLNRNAVLLHSILKEKPRGIFARFRAVRNQLRASSLRQRVGGIVAFALLVALMMLPVEYRIEAPLFVEPVQKRIVTAPFDGVIDEVFVQPGEKVSAGGSLLKLDDEELLLQKTQLWADIKRAQKQKDIELANGTAAEVQILQFEISELQAKIDLINYQLENLLVAAPLDGLVVTGDLKRREGAAVATGEALFEIAPLEEVIVESAVAVEDINRVAVGMPVDIRISALPESKLTSAVSAIHLRSTIRDNRHVYIVESELDNEELLLKPGMVGYAKIAAGQYSLAWVWFHRAWQKFVELLFW